ncbi:hypothetical protein GQX73_g10938 [Xylaria multiplex]|uniref:T6SS Phospholipase effector Tle1-like catalytic domain-containing protein n=1 Tax=Xylaria multiplex TaxID=323545 RepID=A0A7C8MPU7_9PEZI|nr:hypothetical protein GQX73_g10938 [Xylaria multiplex]
MKGNDLNPYTNVLRLSRCIKARCHRGRPQIVSYVSGIGTSDGNLFNIYLQGTGIGIDEKIKEAYNFICHNYENYNTAEEKDEIFLIGFSRGAFVARCVADIINTIGILTKMGIHYLPYIYDWWKRNQAGHSELPQNIPIQVPDIRTIENERDRKQFEEDAPSILKDPSYVHQGVHVKVCAVWDTVASLGLVSTHLSIFSRWKSRKLSFVNSDLCDGIDHAIQALSFHERRRPFCPIVWRLPNNGEINRNEKPRLQQCWFMGYHSDIGGGIRGEGLSHYPLAWMMSKLEDFLEFDSSNFWNPRPIEMRWKIHDKKDASSSLHYEILVDSRNRLEISLLKDWIEGEVRAYLDDNNDGDDDEGDDRDDDGGDDRVDEGEADEGEADEGEADEGEADEGEADEGEADDGADDGRDNGMRGENQRRDPLVFGYQSFLIILRAYLLSRLL